MKNYNLDFMNTKVIKNHRLIYNIHRVLSREEIEAIIQNCEIDFFSIDTAMFENVKNYYAVIDLIIEACEKFSKTIGIIAELSGRKIKVQNVIIDGCDKDDLVSLEKGELVKIKWSGMKAKISNRTNKKKIIYVNFKNLDELVNINEELIINDNKGSLKVIEKLEKEVRILDRVRHRSPNKHKSQAVSCKLNLEKESNSTIAEKHLNLNKEIPSVPSTTSYKHNTFTENPSRVEIMIDYDESIKTQIKLRKQNSFIRKSSIRFSKEVADKLRIILDSENSLKKIQKQNLKQGISSRISVVKELICEAQYNCKINKNAFLFVPNADYKSLGIDLLSCREVNEISHLDSKGVHFICITIKDMDDIRSIREILSENSKLKILASIPDFATLNSIDEIIENTAGIVLSRTFGIKSNKKFDITRLTKSIINKCKENYKPIFTFIDVNSEFDRQKDFILNDVMYNINDGMDGFFIGIENRMERKENQIRYEIKTLNEFSNSFIQFKNDRDMANINLKKNPKNLTSNIFLYSFASNYNKRLENCCYAYIGDNLEDIQHISSMNLKSPCFVFSSDTYFLCNCRLYYSVLPYCIENIDEQKIKSIIEIETGLLGYAVLIQRKKLNKNLSMKLLI